jgi:hypothetical protein
MNFSKTIIAIKIGLPDNLEYKIGQGKDIKWQIHTFGHKVQ